MAENKIITRIKEFLAEMEGKYRLKPSGVVPGYCFDHIVLGDYNLYDGDIDFCLEQKDEWLENLVQSIMEDDWYSDWTRPIAVYEAHKFTEDTVQFLLWLKSIPIEERIQAVEDYLAE